MVGEGDGRGCRVRVARAANGRRGGWTHARLRAAIWRTVAGSGRCPCGDAGQLYAVPAAVLVLYLGGRLDQRAGDAPRCARDGGARARTDPIAMGSWVGAFVWPGGARVPAGPVSGPRVRTLEGPLDAVAEIGERTHFQGRSHFESHSPNLWWPDDQAWCVATEIDHQSTYVGGPEGLISELLIDARFEALESIAPA